MRLALLDRLLALHADGVPAALATALVTGRQAVVSADAIEGDLTLDDPATRAIRTLTADGRPGLIAIDGETVFVEVWSLPLRLVVVGAVHIAQSLVSIAGEAGFRTVIVDPRRAFGSAVRFPGISIDDGWPDEALGRLAPDGRTAVVALTHDPKIDDPALLAALQSDAFYVGALGSHRTHESRRARLAETGLPAERIDRIRAPVGLAIGAVTPAEIAVSIMAEIIAALRGGRLATRAT